MNGKDYVAGALRTEHTPDFVRLGGAPATDRMMARLLHATLGLMSEVGEIADALKKRLIYGKELDLVNLVEEVGDESWYQALLLDAIGSTFEASWERNIAKLRKRFPDKFEASRALDRDLIAERHALEGAVAHPVADEGSGPTTGTPYRTASVTEPTQRHRETPPGQRHGFAPFVPCRNCDNSICLTVKTLQEGIAALRAERDGARIEAANWKIRAERHGCDSVNGDPDCG